MNDNEDQMKVFGDSHALTVAAGERFVELAKRAVAAHGLFTVALSGGSTPKALYRLLATDKDLSDEIPWSKTHFFFGDERHVPPEHPESNFRMASEAMFPVRRTEQLHVHRVLSELSDAAQAAEEYEADLRDFFGPLELVEGEFPRFDLIFLGLGPDGHTASLFPNSAALNESSRWVVANWVEKFKTDRITMTFPVLNAAAEVIVLVAGAEKAAIVSQVLGPQNDEVKFPIQRIRPRDGVKHWMLDHAAAEGIALGALS
jgi:6-phosphogluconolactonase